MAHNFWQLIRLFNKYKIKSFTGLWPEILLKSKTIRLKIPNNKSKLY